MHGTARQLTGIATGLTPAIFGLGFCAQGATGQAAPVSVAITHVTVIDVEHGRRLPDRTVLVNANRIALVAQSASSSVAAGARVIDGRGEYLIPGLWDMHGHIFPHGKGAPTDGRAWHLPLHVASGVTGVRDMWMNLDDFAQMRAWNVAAAEGRLAALLVVSTGPMIDGPTGTSGMSRSSLLLRATRIASWILTA